MGLINFRNRTVDLKVVYYGPPSGGKTTSLQYIHRVLDPAGRVDLLSVATSRDQTLFFDFLPVELGTLMGLRIRFAGFTVPGEVRYSRTRRFVLSGADGVVFVANSDPRFEAENAVSLEDFRRNLTANALDPDRIPLVVQYNKRDLADAVPVERLSGTVRTRDVKEFETVAIRGENVFEAFREVARQMVERIFLEAKSTSEEDARRFGEGTAARLDVLRRQSLSRPGAGGGRRILVPGEVTESPGETEDGRLLEVALAGKMELSRLYAEVNLSRNRLIVSADRAKALNRFARNLLLAPDSAAMWEDFYGACRAAAQSSAATLLVRERGENRLRVMERDGGGEDPLVSSFGESLVFTLEHLGEPACAGILDRCDLLDRVRTADPTVGSVLVAPVSVHGDLSGGVLLYRKKREPLFTLEDVRYVTSLAALAALGIGRSDRETELLDLNRSLESAVRERTARLDEANERLRELNGDLEKAVKVRTRELRAANEQLKKTQERFLQAQKMEAIGRLAGGVAHDFNNLVTVIGGYAELLLRRIPEKAPLRHNVLEIRKATHRAAEVTHQLLAFARRQMLRPRRIDLNRVVDETRTLFERLLGDDIELEVSLAPDLALVRADPGQIQQVLMNLAVNSRDAMCDGGTLTLATENVVIEEDVEDGPSSGTWVMLSVKDTGVGMSEETRSRIFEPFFTTKPPGEGTGLGLSTVYGIVRQSEGHVLVESEPGRGTCIRICFRPVAGTEVREEPSTVPAEERIGSATILVVEDERTVRDLGKTLLEESGHRVLRVR